MKSVSNVMEGVFVVEIIFESGVSVCGFMKMCDLLRRIMSIIAWHVQIGRFWMPKTKFNVAFPQICLLKWTSLLHELCDIYLAIYLCLPCLYFVYTVSV